MKIAFLFLTIRLIGLVASTQTAVLDDSSHLGDPHPVVFNHMYVVVNIETFQILRDNPFFQHEFAAVDSGFPKFAAVNEETQSLYFRGEKTYLEIFGPKNKFNEPVGKVGIGFSVEKVGGLDWIEKQLKRQTDVQFERILRRWDFETETSVNWYHVVYRDFPADSKIVWWFSEYHTDFFPRLFQERGFAQTDIMRSTFLSARYDPKKELKNLLACVLVIEPENAAALIADFTSLGFERRSRDDEGLDLLGPDFVLHLVPADAATPVGLRAIQFDSNKPTERAVKIQFLEYLTVRRSGSTHGWIDLLSQ